MLHAWNSHNATAYPAELGVASSITALKHVHNGANEAVAVLDELTFTRKAQGLEKQTKASLYEYLITVEAEGKAEFTLIKKLDNLHNVLAGIANSYYG